MQFSKVSYLEAEIEQRVDAEFFHPDFLRNANLVDKENTISKFIDDEISNINRDKILKFNYLEIANISTSSLEYSTTEINPETDTIPSRATYILRKDDVLVSTVRPNRNAVAFIFQGENLVGTNGCAILRAQGIDPEYLFAFCKTEYFIKCQMRANKATMYPAVSVEDIIATPIFLPNDEFKNLTVKTIRDAISCYRKCSQLFEQAHQILISELNLQKWKPQYHLSFFKHYSDVKQASRMDADYFQPKYTELIEAIKRYRGGWNTLRGIVSMKGRNFKPRSEEKYKYIELSNINSSGEIIGCTESLGKDLPARARRKVATDDVIVSSVEGSLGSIALIPKEYNKSLCSTGFHVFSSQIISPACLFIFMKSILGQLLLKKGCTDTILTAIGEDELLKIPLPLIEQEIQEQIEEKISSVANLRRRSRALLEVAKRGIEIAIEQDQEAAMAWMNAHVEELE